MKDVSIGIGLVIDVSLIVILWQQHFMHAYIVLNLMIVTIYLSHTCKHLSLELYFIFNLKNVMERLILLYWLQNHFLVHKVTNPDMNFWKCRIRIE